MTDRTRKYGPAAIGGRLRRLSECIDEDAGRVYVEFGIEFQQRWVGVLEQLSKQGPRSVGELAEALGIRHSSVSQARRSLEEAGFIESKMDPGDARSRRLQLSVGGRRMVRQLEPVWELLIATSVDLDEEAGRVIAALERLDAALERVSLYDRVRKRESSTKPRATPNRRRAK